jgi:anti-sigma factor RsiW
MHALRASSAALVKPRIVIQRAGLSALVAVIALLSAATAIAAGGNVIQTEANWVKFDPATKTISVKVTKPGARPKNSDAAIVKGKDTQFDVQPEGSVLTRTTVKINGRKGEFADIAEGKRVLIYWIEDAAKSTKRFARSVDVTLSEEELNERYKLE